MAEADTDEVLRFLVEVLHGMARQELSAQASGGETRAALREAGVGQYLRMAVEQILLLEDSPIELEEAPDDLVSAEDILWLRFSPEEEEDGGG